MNHGASIAKSVSPIRNLVVRLCPPTLASGSSGRRPSLFLAALLALAASLCVLLAAPWPVFGQQSDQEVPARPTGLTGTVSADRVSLSWDDPGDSSITGYQVLRRNPAIQAKDEFTIVEDDTGSASASYTDTTVAPETRYFYRVKARNVHGLSERSGYVEATTPEEPVLTPATPARPTVTSITHDSVTISWTDPGDSSITGYQVLRRNRDTDATGDFTVIEDDTATSDTGYTDDSVQPETPYVYRVKARNVHGLSDWSGFVRADTPAAPENSAASGSPAITGTAQVHEILSADTAGIADANGLSNVEYAYRWVRSTGGVDTDIGAATGATYTLVRDDLDHTVRVRVSFTDDDGYPETLTSAATGAVVRPPNASPGGQPAITGTVEVGETLTVGTSGISDPNGLSNPQYAYQWVRSIGSTDTDISGATGSTYTLTASDLAHTMKVKASFTDDDGYAETLTSAPTEVPDTENSDCAEPPVGLASAVNDDASGIVVTWEAPAGCSPDTYAVYRRTISEDGNRMAKIATVDDAGLTYTDDNVAAGEKYRYRVRSNDQGPRSAWTQTVMTEPEPKPGERTGRAVPRDAVTLISNTGQTTGTTLLFIGVSGSDKFSSAIKFTAGSATNGYTITEASVKLDTVLTNSIPQVSIYTSASNVPGTLKFTFTNPGSFVAGLNTFTAPANSTLAGSTDYFVVIENEGSDNSSDYSISTTASTTDDAGAATGWSLGDRWLSRSTDDGAWTDQGTGSIPQVAIKGSAIAATDATLSALTLKGTVGSEVINLDPTFDGDTYTYTAAVVNRIDAVTLTATKNDSNATVAITGDDDAATPDEAEFDLGEGSNTLEVVVTAEDGVASETYTITATRAIPPPAPTDCPTDTHWCATMTAGFDSAETPEGLLENSGYVADFNTGDLSSTMFSLDGVSYDITRIQRARLTDSGTVVFDVLALELDRVLPDGTVFQVGSLTFTVDTNSATAIMIDGQEQEGSIEKWDLDVQNGPPAWTRGQNITVSLKLPPKVTIAADATSAVYREDASAFTLTRTGATTGTLAVTVELTQTGGRFISNLNLSKTVTFAVGSATAALSVDHQEPPLGKAISSGTLTATVVDGTDYDVGTADTAEMDIIVAMMSGFDMDSYTVNEEAGTLQVTLVGRTGVGAPVPPDVYLSVTSKGGIEYDEEFPASSPEDYGAISVVAVLSSAEFVPDGDVFREEYTIDIPIFDDDVDEEDETFFLILERTPGLPDEYDSRVDASGGVI